MNRIVELGVIASVTLLLIGCGGTSGSESGDTIPMTEKLLDGKVFYGLDTHTSEDGQISEYYGKSKYVFPKVLKIKMQACPCEEHQWLIDSHKQSVAIEGGKLKVTTGHHGVIYITLHEIEGNTWDVSCEQDADSDGVMDKNGTGIWYTTEPDGFPEFPAFSGDMDEEELENLMPYSLFSCGL